MATFYQTTAQAPTAAQVIINGVANAMTVEIGSAGQGSYVYEDVSQSSCRMYWFRFVDSTGTEVLYPEDGALYTTQEGTCTQTWSSTK
jgi:hypothetical protein